MFGFTIIRNRNRYYVCRKDKQGRFKSLRWIETVECTIIGITLFGLYLAFVLMS